MKKRSQQSRTGDKRGASSREGAARVRKPAGRRVLVWKSFALVAVACVCAFALVRQRNRLAYSEGNAAVRPNTPLLASQFGQFPPSTEAERELEKMLRGKDEGIDLGLANWLVAADVPQFATVTRDAYLKQLDAMTDHVRHEIARRREVAKSKGKDPDEPGTRCAIFCGAMISLGFSYREEFAKHDLTPAQMRGLYADANNTFLAGLLRTMRGSCVSMPLIYGVIGQRLGYPVHLVHVGKHCFIRWQEPGYRVNVETTAVDHVWVTDDDSAYLEDERMMKDQVAGNELRNLSNREVVGGMLFIRSSHWVMKAEQEHTKSWMDLSRAFHLSPDDPAIARTYQSISGHYGLKPDQSMADLERIDRAARAQVVALKAEGVGVPANVFGGMPGDPAGSQWQQPGPWAATGQSPNTVGGLAQRHIQQALGLPGGNVAMPQPRGLPPYPRPAGPGTSELKGIEHE